MASTPTPKTNIKSKKKTSDYASSPIVQDLLSFLDQSPTAWHAVEQVKLRLLAQGFTELSEDEKWSLQKGKKYFTIRNGSSLCAFITPSKHLQKACLIASHTDSPALKLKPKGEYQKENMLMLGVEVYGAPLLTSWLNRDLGIAGRIVYLDGKEQIKKTLVSFSEHPLVIPQLAIHLDRKVNEEGLLLNKQDHLSALAALDPQIDGKGSYIERLIKQKISFKELLSFDLFLFPLEQARLVGYQKEMLSSYRLDSLGSVHAITSALLATQASPHTLQMGIFWDHEEIGSSTASGAASPFLSHTLERICIANGMDREEYLRLLSHALCVSVDLAHALHPNYPERHDPRHQPLLSKGIIVKSNAQQRYATDASTAAFIALIAHNQNLSLQPFVSRSDIPCGSTIGPIHATLTGMPTVDIGYPQLSMHSSRELIACQDHIEMSQFLKHAFLSEFCR